MGAGRPLPGAEKNIAGAERDLPDLVIPADGVDVTAAQNPDKPEQRMHIRLVLPAGSSLRAVEDPVFRTAEGLDQSVDAPGCVRQKKIRMQRQHLFFSRIATKSE